MVVMDTSKIKKYEGQLRAKFLANPLLYIMIFCAIFGIIIPFFKAIIPDGNVTKNDLVYLKNEVKKIKDTYEHAEESLQYILDNVANRPIRLSYDKLETLKLLAHERRSVFSAFFSFIAFLLQGIFFFALGLLLEHRFNIFRQIMPKKKIVPSNNDTSINEDDTAGEVEFEEDSQEEAKESNQEEVKDNKQEEAKDNKQEEVKDNKQEEVKDNKQEEVKDNNQEEFEDDSEDDSEDEFEEESQEKASNEPKEL